MRAGKMDRTITIQLPIEGEPDEAGQVIPTWQTLATVRAQIMQASTEEFLRAYGTTDNYAVIFRLRYLSGVTVRHRVQHDGMNLNIREVKEIGRRKGLELRCEALS